MRGLLLIYEHKEQLIFMFALMIAGVSSLLYWRKQMRTVDLIFLISVAIFCIALPTYLFTYVVPPGTVVEAVLSYLWIELYILGGLFILVSSFLYRIDYIDKLLWFYFLGIGILLIVNTYFITGEF